MFVYIKMVSLVKSRALWGRVRFSKNGRFILEPWQNLEMLNATPCYFQDCCCHHVDYFHYLRCFRM